MVRRTVDESNAFIQEMEGKGYRIWNDHPGYTIEYLQEMLAPFGLRVETFAEEGNDWLWFRVTAS